MQNAVEQTVLLKYSIKSYTQKTNGDGSMVHHHTYYLGHCWTHSPCMEGSPSKGDNAYDMLQCGDANCRDATISLKAEFAVTIGLLDFQVVC